MQLPKPTDDEKELFRSVIPDAPTVTIKPMFGSLGAFVNGNMFAGLFGSDIGIRVLDDATRAELQAIDGTGPFGPSERPMKEYVTCQPHGHPSRSCSRTGLRAPSGRSRRCRRRSPSRARRSEQAAH